ncbi:MAG TPA: cytochrome bd-I oxidase subunit CydX [Rhizomicrobium sp.]|jgi:cyd operon protein YbgT|nr:cytochrome bd-I oxidase subunit CydX [Rhizomicrobium sp.]
MWYFSWVLGLGFAVTFAVLNAIWLEQRREQAWMDQRSERDR